MQYNSGSIEEVEEKISRNRDRINKQRRESLLRDIEYTERKNRIQRESYYRHREYRIKRMRIYHQKKKMETMQKCSSS